MAYPYTGQLNSNEVFAALMNMIISQQVFADNIYDTKSTLADMSRVDGSLYGDTKLYYSTDVLKSFEWTGDAEAQNLLKLHRPEAPECQAITIDKFRMIPVTVDNYLSKRAWSTEGAFSSFNSQILGWIRDTKKVYDATLFNSFVGTTTSLEGKQNVNIVLPADPLHPRAAQDPRGRVGGGVSVRAAPAPQAHHQRSAPALGSVPRRTAGGQDNYRVLR